VEWAAWAGWICNPSCAFKRLVTRAFEIATERLHFARGVALFNASKSWRIQLSFEYLLDQR
jgi:hypothetical protein